MRKYQKIENILKENNGYLFVKKAVDEGISRTYVMSFIKENNLEQVSRGIYTRRDCFIDDLFVLQQQNHGLIYSHETAAYLHGLAEREPFSIVATVKQGYNGAHLKSKNICIHYVQHERYELQSVTIRTEFGNPVRAYSIDRTIVDLLKEKRNLDIQFFTYALKEYMCNNNKNITDLFTYAKKTGLENELRKYTEVML